MKSPALVILGTLAAASTVWAQFYEHVVITSRELVSAYVPLCSVVENTLGYEDTVVTVEDIYSSFPGRDNPEKIRSFIQFAYSEWLTTWVLLGGDVEVVPCRYAWGNNGSGEDIIPCDLYYAALDGDWDADGDNVFGERDDSVDLYPDIHVGRFTATSMNSMDVLVEKFRVYCGNPDAPYLERMFLNGFDLYEWCIAEEAMEFYDSTLVPETMKPCIKVYDSHGGNHRDSTLYCLNQGQHIWVHSDHSGWSAMGAGWNNHREVLSRSDLAGLINQDKPTIMMTNGCSAGAFDSTDCIIENFVMAPQGGGVAAYANSRTGLLDRTKPLHGQSFMQLEGLLRAWFDYPRQARLGDLVEVQAQVAPLAAVDDRYRYTHYQFTLFGDPLMPVWLPEQSGVEEMVEGGGTRLRDEGGRMNQTIVRGVLRLPAAGMTNDQVQMTMLDATGRKVMELRPGENDVRGLAPGVYFVRGEGARIEPSDGTREDAEQGSEGSSVRIVIAR
jgi:hypothetical protein